MSELINNRAFCGKIRNCLLATACAATLLGAAGVAARAASDEQPGIWLELGGQFDRSSATQEDWSPAFTVPADPLAGSFANIQRLPKSGYDADAALSFRPEHSDWVFSAAIRYGKANRHADGQAHQTYETRYHHRIYPYENNYNAATRSKETHAILDFMAGKDVGLGVIGTGIRIAQLHSRSQTQTDSLFYLTQFGHADNDVHSDASRSFRGISPRLSWDASAPLAGRLETGRVGFDWGVNAAMLFGRQSATATQSGTAHQQYYKKFPTYAIVRYTQTVNTVHARRKSVIVPDLGGFAGLSYRFPNAKFSIGYRADMFFNAIDGGIAEAKKENRGFHGAFVSFSVGVSPSDF